MKLKLFHREPNTKLANKTKSQLFKDTYYPHVSNIEWNSWKWQLSHRITSVKELSRFLTLSENEIKAFNSDDKCFPFSITPYYVSLLDRDNPEQGIRKTVVPDVAEHIVLDCESEDHLHETQDSPVPCIVHRYPDRVLFLVTNFCSTYCRYCTRSRMVGGREHYSGHAQWEQAIEYIKSNKNIRDVLLSGGDPLTMPTDELEWLLSRLSKIEHVQFLRLGTKVPVVLPQRINIDLTNMLKKYHPLWMSIHFTHPDELTEETINACSQLADAGIPLGSQVVLLKGVNDSAEVQTELSHKLLQARVKPYYLYQCDLVPGSSHFRTSIDKGIEIIDKMRGYTSGYAVPNYIVDAPNGGGKIRVYPEAIVGRENGNILLKNYEGDIYRYPEDV